MGHKTRNNYLAISIFLAVTSLSNWTEQKNKKQRNTYQELKKATQTLKKKKKKNKATQRHTKKNENQGNDMKMEKFGVMDIYIGKKKTGTCEGCHKQIIHYFSSLSVQF